MFEDPDRETYFNENVSYDVGTLGIQQAMQAPLYQVYLLDFSTT